MNTPPPRRTGGYPDRPDLDDDAAQSTDYDGGLRAAAEGGRVAMFRGTGTGTAGPPVTGPQPTPDVDSPFMGLFDDGPRDRVRPISGIPISAVPTSGAGRAPEDLRAPKRVPPRTNGERLPTRPARPPAAALTAA